MIAFLLVVGVSFYLAAASTIRLVGVSLFEQTVRMRIAEVNEIATAVGECFSEESVDALYQRLLRMARTSSGRLLLVDMDGKVQLDTFDECCGQRVMLAEVYDVLSGKTDADYGFHQQAVQTGKRNFLPFRALIDEGSDWMGCFAVPLLEQGERIGALVLCESVQDTVDALINMQERLLLIFGIAMAAVLALVALISRVVTKPVAELSAGIERMAKGDYRHRVRVKGRSELAQLAAAFNLMSEQVYNLDEARNQFVSNASHELKTPLTTIKLLVESMMYEPEMDPTLRLEFLGDIDKEIDRLTLVVGDLLTLAHIDSHKLRLRRREMELADTVRESVDRLKPLAQKSGLKLEMHVQDVCEMFADPDRLSQVCYNIIENAIKYTPAGGKISIDLRKDGRDAVMEITDTGVGIPAEDLPHIFDRFYRVDKARGRDTGGTGLGLSIVQQIVRLHGGSVNVQSKVGEGTDFTVQLPLK